MTVHKRKKSSILMFDLFAIAKFLIFIMPRPHRVGHNALMADVCLSAPCLTLSREWNGIASWKSTGMKLMKRMTRDPSYGSKGGHIARGHIVATALQAAQLVRFTGMQWLK